MANSTEFSIDIKTNASAAEKAAALVDKLSSSLDVASKAAQAASVAVKAGEASYNAAEAAANKAALAVEKIALAAEAQRSKMEAAMKAGNEQAFWKAAAAAEALGQKQAAAQVRADAAKAALDAEATALDKLRAASTAAADGQAKASAALDAAKKSAADASAQENALLKSQKAASDAAKKQAESQAKIAEASHLAANGTGRLSEIAEGLGKVGGPLGAVGQKAVGAVEGVKKLFASLGSSGGLYAVIAAAAVALAAGIGAVGLAAAGGIASIAAWAVGLADAARSQSLLAAGIARSAVGGEQLTAKIDELTGKIPLSREELMSTAKTLGDAGLRGKALTDALQTAAVKASTLKFGPDFQKQMFSLPNQAARFSDNIKKLFSGLKIDGFLKALDRIGELFESDKASGKAIKSVFESMFQPLIDGATSFLPKARTAFIQFEILVLKALIAIKPWGSTILKVAAVVGILAAVILGGLAIAVGVVIAGVALMSIGIGFAVAVVTALAVGAAYLGAMLLDLGVTANDAIVGTFGRAIDYLKNTSLTQIGIDMITGLANGITGAGGAVLTAMKNVVSGAVDSARKTLGIASPSKVFAEIGGYTAEGMQQGVEGGAGEVQGALETMVSPPAPTAGAPAATASESSDGGAGTIIVQINGVAGSEDIIPALRTFLQDKRAQLADAALTAAKAAA